MSVLRQVYKDAEGANPRQQMSSPYRMLVSHSTRDTKVRALWCFIDELQTALDVAKVPILLVNVVSECGGMIVEDLSAELRNATSRTDLTMMVLTRGYVDSNWCDDEMHARARSACTECPSHRLFPLRWRNYPWAELWSRRIEGWGVDLQGIMTDELLAAIEGALGDPKTRPDEWRHAIDATVAALGHFICEVEATCTSPQCPRRVPATTPLPSRLG